MTEDERQAKDRQRRSEFFVALMDRLDAGARQYGERSFARKPAVLIREMQEEALDIAGWGYVLWVRLEALYEAALDAQDALAP